MEASESNCRKFTSHSPSQVFGLSVFACYFYELKPYCLQNEVTQGTLMSSPSPEWTESEMLQLKPELYCFWRQAAQCMLSLLDQGSWMGIERAPVNTKKDKVFAKLIIIIDPSKDVHGYLHAIFELISSLSTLIWWITNCLCLLQIMGWIFPF